MTVLLRLIEHPTRSVRTFQLHDDDVRTERGTVIAFVLHDDQGSSELFVLSSMQRAHQKPALIQAVSAHLSLRNGAYIGQRWGTKGAAIGAFLAVLGQELLRIYSSERAEFYADSHGRIRFSAPAEVLR